MTSVVKNYLIEMRHLHTLITKIQVDLLEEKENIM